LLLACIIAPFFIFSQTYNLKTFSLDEGLSQSEVSCMLEDSRGYLWLGTRGGGVCRFDGKEIQAFEEKEGLSGQLVTAIAEDAKGKIWISTTWGGISSYDGKLFVNHTQKDGLPGNHFDQITVDNRNNIILCSHSTIALFDGIHSTIVSEDVQAMNNNDVTCICKDHKGNIWLGTKNGLLVLKGKELHEFRKDPRLRKGNIVSVCADENGDVYFVNNKGEFYKIKISGSPDFESLQASSLENIQLPGDAEISGLLIDRKNQLWVSTLNQGLYKFSKGNQMIFDVNNGLPTNAIRSLYEDHAGCIWIGTSGSGFIRFTDLTFTYYDNLEGFRRPDVFAICCDKQNQVWASSVSQGLFSFDGHQIKSYNPVPTLKGFITRVIYCDKKGKLWLGGPKGIRTYDGKAFKSFTNLPDSSNVNAAVFTEDSYGNLWIGTRGQGVFCFDGSKTQHFTSAEGLRNPNVYSMCEDNTGTMWFGTGDGIFKLNKGRFIPFASDGICNPYIGSMVKDKFGNLWMGTDNCVVLYNGKNFRSITPSDGLSSGTVYLLNLDDYGNIWVGTNKGVDEITLNSNGQIKLIRNFGKSEGFKGVECNSRATCIDNSGNIWFGTIKGVIRYNPGEETERSEFPSIHITQVRLFYEKSDWGSYSDSLSHWDHLPINTTLPYDKNHITFDFKAIDKTLPENIKYSFNLKGFDNDWSPESPTSFATYSNLPPGQYTFRVKAGTKQQGWNETPSEFSFTIQKPFWGTWWFIGIGILSIGICLYLYNELRKKKSKAEREELEKVIHLRTIELIRQREEKEVLLKEVHHRVKNNLQVINSLISIQSSFIQDTRSLDIFEECKSRIRAIALIHEKLYRSEDFGRINVKEYIQILVQHMIESYNINKKIALILDMKVEHLNLNTTVSFGLLLNEIISNSLKYAFEGMDRGEIVLRLNTTHDFNNFVLIIGDNGKGYKGDPFENESSPTLGLELVKILAEQLNGKIEKMKMEGTYYKLIFQSLKN
jgi:two-component sensor histidine kinase/ligand-binding sensor domain-containing protein